MPAINEECAVTLHLAASDTMVRYFNFFSWAAVREGREDVFARGGGGGGGEDCGELRYNGLLTRGPNVTRTVHNPGLSYTPNS